MILAIIVSAVDLHLSYLDVCGARRDHDEVVVTHRHVPVLDHIGDGLTSRTIPSANTTFVLLIDIIQC